MRNLKKFLALVLAMMMVFSLMVTVNASSFDDKEDVTKAYGEAVDVLSALGVVKGYGEGDPNEGKFLPKNPISRAEVAAILYRLYTGDVGDDSIHLYKGYTEFNDVKVDDWFAPYVNFCYNNGLIQGVGNNNFAPRANVTGYEALVMILRAIGYNNPSEFSNPDWKFKASGYGSKLGLTENIASGSLGLAATREVVSEIMFKGLIAPMVKYSPLTMYTTDLLVDASAVNEAYSEKLYSADVPNTLMYQTFDIVGYRTVYGFDPYGRPQKEWVTDHEDDTIANGGLYIPNIEDTYGSVDPDANGATNADYADPDETELEIPETPVKTYKGEVVTECQFTTDVNNNKTIAKENFHEFLNGGTVAQRSANLDINHTQEGTIGAPGRTTEVYKLSNGHFVVVYIDNFMGVVTSVTKRTFDTAGNHVMSPARMTVRVNDDIPDVLETSTTKDFDYSVGDRVLMTTYGMKNLDPNDVDQASIDPTKIQTLVPAAANDFLTKDDDTSTAGVDSWDAPTFEDVTVKGTMGTKDHKTGIETDKGNKYANVVYLASKSDSPDGVAYYCDATGTPTTITTETTVPSTSPYNYGYRMVNAAINKSYTIYKDANGFVVGMTTAETGTDIGIVASYEPKRISTGKWAMEVNLYMSDGTDKTVLMLAGSSADKDANPGEYTAPSSGTEPVQYVYFKNQTEAETNFSEANLAIEENALVKIQAYVKDGATYYKPIETHKGLWTDWDDAIAADDNSVQTGVAYTLKGNDGTSYSANPVTWDKANDALAPDYNVDDDTKFIIAQVDWDYSMNENNQGGYNDLELSVYTGFKNIPTVEGGSGCVVFQRIDNTVYVHPDALDSDLDYTVKKQPTYSVADAYLVYDTGTTYQNYSVYKALKNGVEVDLEVSNNNLTLVNNKIETAMAKGTPALVIPTSTNSRGYVTDVELVNGVATTPGQYKTHTIAKDANVSFNKHGVMYVSDYNGVGLSHPTDVTTSDDVNFLTVDKDVKVVIVNLETGNYYPATQDSIMQYENWTEGGVKVSHAFVYELNQYGYVSTVYIID